MHPSAIANQLLDWLERAGNRLPSPAALFVYGTLLVMVVSQLAASLGWSVQRLTSHGGRLVAAGETIHARGLLDSDGLWWLMSHLVENFVRFPPLGLVLVGMLGIGLAERSGLLPALLQAAGRHIPGRLLTPALVLLGILSSVALDAGYVVLPPLAATLYIGLRRPPLAGIAAVFAGVSAGFGANLVITGLDPLLAGFSQTGAQVLDAHYQVAVTSNWWFMIASTVLLTLAGWLVTARMVEPRMDPPGNIAEATADTPPESERRALRAAGAAAAGVLALAAAAVLIPGAPLHGHGAHFPRWIEVTVPLLFIVFIVPGIAYGRSVGTLRTDKDMARVMGETMASLGPYIVLAFFAAQFIEAFKYSGLGEMLAISGGQWLTGLHTGPGMLMGAFVLLVMTGNLLLGSMSAKYAFFAPVFVPMFMQVGISPELTQVAYRIGDSVSNVITPLNPYMIVILALIQKYARDAGLGTIVALMLPYTVVFAVVWTLLLLVWIVAGWPLGPGGGLTYPGP